MGCQITTFVVLEIHKSQTYQNDPDFFGLIHRITPKYNFDNTQYLENSFDYVDNCVVESEEFVQWIIEDKIQNNFPDLTKFGVDIVKNVEDYQEIK